MRLSFEFFGRTAGAWRRRGCVGVEKRHESAEACCLFGLGHDVIITTYIQLLIFAIRGVNRITSKSKGLMPKSKLEGQVEPEMNTGGLPGDDSREGWRLL